MIVRYQEDRMTTDRIVTDFMTASAHLESYLQQRGPLTAVQQDAIANTMQGLQTFFDLWKMKRAVPSPPRETSAFSPPPSKMVP